MRAGGVLDTGGAGSFTGALLAGDVLSWAGRSRISSPADGKLLVTNAAGTGFTSVAYGGTTNAFPMWKRSATTLQARLADDSADAGLSGLTLILNALTILQGSASGALKFGPAGGGNPQAIITAGPFNGEMVLGSNVYSDDNNKYLQIRSTAGFTWSTTATVTAAAGTRMLQGAGTPEGAITAPVGSTYHRNDGGAGTSFYVKESGAGNTGWIGK